MNSSTAAKYASALADICLEQGVSEEVGDELSVFISVLESHEELHQTLFSPALPLDVKQNIVRETAVKAKFHKSTLNFLLVLLERNRIGLLSQILEAYRLLLDERAGIARVNVLSAEPLGVEVRNRLEKAMRRVTGKQVKLEYQIDKSLIAGLKVQVGSTVIDGTVQIELEQLRRQLEV